MNDPHAKYSSEWGTPPQWAEWARRTLGGIDLDPCSSDEANEVVRADRYLSAGGLDAEWSGKIYCNPPGTNGSTSVREWWAAGRDAVDRGHPIVWCFFNWETTVSLDRGPLTACGWLILPRRRVSFLRGGEQIRSPRNRTAFWTNRPPATTPEPSFIAPTPFLWMPGDK